MSEGSPGKVFAVFAATLYKEKKSLIKQVERLTEKRETDLIDPSEQRHELAEESSTQTGDVDEGTLVGR